MLVFNFHFYYVFQDHKLLASSFPLSTGVAYILSLGVTSSFRSKGVASILLKSFIGYVSGENMDWLNNSSHQVDLTCSNLFNQTNNVNTNYHHNHEEYDYFDKNVSMTHSNTYPSMIWRLKDYKSLYNLITQLPRVSPVQAIYLHVLHSNLHARRFYENRGFICLHTRPGCYTINGRSADGCTYVLHTNGGYLDCKPLNYNLNTIYEYFNDYSLINCYARWIIRFFSQSGHNILYILSRFLHYLCDTPTTFVHHHHYNQQQQQTQAQPQEYISHFAESSISDTTLSSSASLSSTSTSSSLSCVSSDSTILDSDMSSIHST
ncbi:unnamed protein product [Schistosoma turkestanicum]|nr:unnamed protein product [Schistosoma turkestanicum]